MQRLILLRHGKAESASSSGEDFERALTDAIDASVLEAAKGCRVFSNMAVGYNNIDVAAAKPRGHGEQFRRDEFAPREHGVGLGHHIP